MKGQEYIPMTHFIVNPQSRSGKGVLVWAEVEKQLKLKQNPYELHMTTCQGDAVKLARQLSNAANETGETVNIVGLGGDGTLCEVLNGLIISDKVNLGYLPTGSGNDFGRSMHYPSNILTMVERITDEPETMPIDFGTVKLGTKPFDENRFAVSCGIGYDAAVCDALLTSRVKKFFNSIHLGKLAYLVVGLMELFKMKLSNGYMVVDGKRIELSKVSFISCHIQPFEGGGFRFAPNAYAQDGLLEVCVISGGNKFALIPVLLKALFQAPLNSPYVHHYSCKKIYIHMDTPRSTHTDGEVHGPQTDITVSDSGQKINFIKI